jgi:hypothetical protein
MLLRFYTSTFRFVYTFDSGHTLVGLLEGDFFPNSPHCVFNLRSLRALCFDPNSEMVMSFDTVFGQFTLHDAGALFSGSQSDDDSFFSFNYRDAEASIYDAATNTWLASGWQPQNWQVEAIHTTRWRSPANPQRPGLVMPMVTGPACMIN